MAVTMRIFVFLSALLIGRANADSVKEFKNVFYLPKKILLAFYEKRPTWTPIATTGR